MTSGAALVLALSLFVHNFSLWCGDLKFLKDGHTAETFVFLFSVCLLISRIDFLPYSLAKKHPIIHCLLEVPIVLILTECALYYFWGGIQDYIYNNAEDILLFLSEELQLHWLVCHFCCQDRDCAEKLGRLSLRVVSFNMLLASCVFNFM